MPAALTSGLLVLQGNRVEDLAQTVLAWLARHPLGPLEPEVLLVPSNGMGEWLKMQLAQAHGVCAASRVELPGRFVWRLTRQLLGRAEVPATLPLDKLPLAWRLMALLPTLLHDPDFAPLAAHLGTPQSPDAGATEHDALRLLQLAMRLADLFDQYQVYRGHWLDDWAAGREQLRGPRGTLPLAPDQRWQARLWQALLAALPPAARDTTRPGLHRRTLQALQEPAAAAAVPRRVVVFGTTHLPQPVLQVLLALAAHTQLLLAVPNPCRWHWADLIEGRELLTAPRRRQPLRGGIDLSALPLQALHAHGHPLLAAWGRQARDFVRQLDAFDDAAAARQRFGLQRLDLFDDGPGHTLLAQLQASVRENLPLAELRQATGQDPAADGAQALPAWPALADDDRSVTFHTAHSALREVEVLHDHLLQALGDPALAAGGRPLQPREIVVMAPQVETFAAAVAAVFGQFPRGHERHIPWSLADRQPRGQAPLLVALEWLLQAPLQRATLGELRALLEVPAVARRLGLPGADIDALWRWVEQAGVRWGLDGEHRRALGPGLDGNDELNTWAFGLRRLVMGYAAGPLPLSADGVVVEPLPQVAGLQAARVGALDEWLQGLRQWCRLARTPATPAGWGQRLRTLLTEQFSADDEDERTLLAALDEALAAWLAACEAAGFAGELPLAAVREAWLAALDEQAGASARFQAGGVTFCTLLPLRAIPFRVVCLLGMNEGAFPRPSQPADFDLMALPGQALPGDRSRRDDDRQLLLDAVLSARDRLWISGCGRSAQDHQPLEPSVLVAQLRDFIAAGWGPGRLQANTLEHPLQPFSRRYFETGAGLPPAPTPDASAPASGPGPQPPACGPGQPPPLLPPLPLFTYASEWRAVHAETAPATAPGAAGPASATRGDAPSPAPGGAPEAAGPWPALRKATATLSDLQGFLKHPVRAFFEQRLQTRLRQADEPPEDTEPGPPEGLERWQLLQRALQDCQRGEQLLPTAHPDAAAALEARPALPGQAVARLRRSGALPWGGVGDHEAQRLLLTLQPMWRAWCHLHPGQRRAVDGPELHFSTGSPPPHPAVLSLADHLPPLDSGDTDAAGLTAQAGPVGPPAGTGAAIDGPDGLGDCSDPGGAGGLGDLTGAGRAGGRWWDLQPSRLQVAAAGSRTRGQGTAGGRPRAQPSRTRASPPAGPESAGNAPAAGEPPDPPATPALRAEPLLAAYLRCLASAATGQPVAGVVVAADGLAHCAAPAPADAAAALADLLLAWAEGTQGPEPWPTALATGLAALEDLAAARLACDGPGEGHGWRPARCDRDEPHLARLFPDFDALSASPRFAQANERLYRPLQRWLAEQVRFQPWPDGEGWDDPDDPSRASPVPGSDTADARDDADDDD